MTAGMQKAQSMLAELMELLMRPDLTQEEKDAEESFKGGGVHGMKPGAPAPRVKEALHWVKCRFEDNSVDYLPQVFLDPDSGSTGAGGGGAGRAGGGGGRAQAAPVEIPAGYVGLSLLCSHDFNVASQMPVGMYMTSREECESGRHAWYEICCREFSAKSNQFKDQVRELLKWFKGATSFDKNAVLEFPPIFEPKQRAEMHDVGNKIGLAHHSSGPKYERRLMVCSNLEAIKNIQKRGGISAVAASGAATVQHGINRKAQLQQANMSSLDSAASTAEIIATVKERLVHILEAYQPQGLMADVLINEYTNLYGEPLPCDAWKRLTGARIRARDFVDMMLDVLVVLSGTAGPSGSRSLKERIALPSVDAPTPAQPPPQQVPQHVPPPQPLPPKPHQVCVALYCSAVFCGAVCCSVLFQSDSFVLVSVAAADTAAPGANKGGARSCHTFAFNQRTQVWV